MMLWMVVSSFLKAFGAHVRSRLSARPPKNSNATQKGEKHENNETTDGFDYCHVYESELSQRLRLGIRIAQGFVRKSDTTAVSYEAQAEGIQVQSSGQTVSSGNDTFTATTFENPFSKYGNVGITLTTEEFQAAGFDFGDVVTLSFLNQSITVPY
jgi:hypothetical protein